VAPFTTVVVSGALGPWVAYVDRARPFPAVDPAFADLLAEAAAAGVEVSAVAIRFDPPTVRPSDAGVPIDLE
jgi:DNA-binding sugar fermentation-stimulating protein